MKIKGVNIKPVNPRVKLYEFKRLKYSAYDMFLIVRKYLDRYEYTGNIINIQKAVYMYQFLLDNYEPNPIWHKDNTDYYKTLSYKFIRNTIKKVNHLDIKKLAC